VGGLTSRQLVTLVRGLAGLDLVGMDLVAVAPPFDHAEITSLLAANLVYEALSVLALAKQGGR
jgi:arginase family enzyme